MRNRYRYGLRFILLMLVCFADGKAMAQGHVQVHGSVYGGGNLADVKTNTAVNIGGGQIDGNVFGGGNKGVVSGTATVNIE